MPGAKRKIDEDTWIVSQSKKFKQGILLSSVYDNTLAQLRLGARNFFNTLLMREDSINSNASPLNSPTTSPSPGTSAAFRSSSPPNTPPGSPAIRDIISENELNIVPPIARPTTVCQDCIWRYKNPSGNEDGYGKCAYCDKLACHVNSCRGCGNEFCAQCCITKYDSANSEAYECYNCLH